MKIYLFFGVLILMIAFDLNGQNLNHDSNYRDISNYGLKDFIAMDNEILKAFKTKDKFKNAIKSIRSIPNESFRYIDSIDIRRIQDSMIIKVYSQNYLYRSQNSYRIGANRDESNDTLMIYNIGIDFKIKSYIDDAEGFRNYEYNLAFTDKTLNDKSNTQRIIINKNKL
jgi:hypothetical protein